MKKPLPFLIILLLCSGHDLFLKLDDYRLKPNAPARLQVFNGTFEESDNTVARHRMKDMSLIGLGNRTHPDTMQWSEKDNVTILEFKTGKPGTWVAGLSTFPKDIKLKAKEFNEYLEHDGVIDMLDWRKQNNAMEQDAVEKYSKHVKAIFQVGDTKTEDWKTVLGYPIEFVPEQNPYDLKVGESLSVKLLWNGQTLTNQLVYAGSNADGHGHSHAAGESHLHGTNQLRTDSNGLVALPIRHEGIWYLRTIRLVPSEETGLTHESNWATLSFQVGKAHGHDHSHGLPMWGYIIAAVVVIVALVVFRQRRRHGQR
jgi:hypothetical protein